MTMRGGRGVAGRVLVGAVIAALAGWLAALGGWGVGAAAAVPAPGRVAVALLLLLGGLLLALRVAGSYRVHGWGVLVLALALTLGLLVTGWVISGRRDLEGWGQMTIAAAAPVVLGAAVVVGLVLRARLESRGIDPLP
ncbi:hypothetical protein [Ornithinimicrobium tianjinense]|uniref:hypothetical protein n=1 Tax=Ornithinimicrobium tianjinense TaxID=1195761 RepID=UPI001663F222|nr:hypothetical protein [Ornithinimicrobium tianjinense]